MPDVAASPPSRSRRIGVLIFLLALGARAVAAAGMVVIPRDGVTYLDLAGRVAQGGVAEAFRSIQHPLYPLVGGLLGGGETTLLLIGVFAGSTGVWAMLRIGTAVATRPVGVVAAVLYAVAPAMVTYEASVLTEGLYIPLFLWAVALTLGAMEKPGRGFGGGILCGLAYLTRPDALLAGLLMPFGLLLVRRWRGALLTGIGFAVLAGPYITWMSADAGRLVVSREKSRIERFADRDLPGEDPAAPRPPRASAGDAALDTARTLAEANSWILLLLAAAGLLPLLRGKRRAAARLLLLLALLEVVVRWRLRYSFGYLAERHLLTAAALLLPFAAQGLLRIPGKKAVFAVAVVATVLLLFAVRPRRVEKLGIKEAGLWIRAVSGPEEVVGHYGLPRVAWYAGREAVGLMTKPAAGIRDEPERVDWLVLEVGFEPENPLPVTPVEGRTFGTGNQRIRVYRVVR